MAAHHPRLLAITFYGMLPRFNREAPSPATCEKAGLDVLAHLVLPALRDRVVRTALRSTTGNDGGFDKVHIYGHTFDIANKSQCSLRMSLLSTLHSTFGPSMIGVVDVLALGATNLALAMASAPIQALHKRYPESIAHRHIDLFSMEQAVGLLTNGMAGTTPVLMLRWDCIFWAPTSLHTLNYHLFYRANWCAATRSPAVPGECIPMKPTSIPGCTAGNASDAPGVPDYWFVANASAMRLVFYSALSDLVAGRWACILN